MLSLIQERLEQLKDLCVLHYVKRLILVGSATRADFNPLSSDLDFLVVFDESFKDGYAQNYFDLECALEDLFEKPIDLISGQIKNPYVLKNMEKTQEVLYVAA
jgi:uncharacterized protein